MTEFVLYWITGFSIGVEWADDPEEDVAAFIMDLGILRLMWVTYKD